MGRDDIDVSVEKGTLTLCGEKKFEKEVDAESAYRQERFYGSFTRSFVLPTAIDPDRIQGRLLARSSGGVLLQAAHRGGFAMHVVPDFGFRHRLPHGGGGARHRPSRRNHRPACRAL